MIHLSFNISIISNNIFHKNSFHKKIKNYHFNFSSISKTCTYILNIMEGIMRFIVISIKKYFFTVLFLLFTLSLILFSATNLEAAKNGLILWANSVVPTLFPFFVATELLCKTNFIQILGKSLNQFMKPVFNVPGESAIAIIMGIISGYPVGAKVVCNLYDNKICSKSEAERLIAFTNNSGPIFILGSVGVSLLGNVTLGKTLLISHILASLCVGLVFRFWKKDKVDITFRNFRSESKELIRISNLGEILGDAIKKSISTILSIGGFVVLFSVIISILSNLEILTGIASFLANFGIPYDIAFSILTGIIEMTNGVNLASSCYSSLPIPCLLTCSFLLGFGGISVLLQVFSIISKSKISIKPYLYGKLLQGTFSVIFTFILLQI